MMNQIIRYKPIIDFIRCNKTENILEVWSGSKWIWKFMPYLKYTWLDTTTSDYELQANTTSKNMKFINGDVLNMPFPDNAFDLVFSLDMLEHIPKDWRLDAVNEIIRVTNNHAIIAFPYWELGTLLDRVFCEYTMLKNWKIEGWLEEHISNWLPDAMLVENIRWTQISCTIEEFSNWNIFLVMFILYLEQIYWFATLSRILSWFVKFFPITFNSKYWVRKFLILKKYA